jgi:hypothetical protein
MALTWTDCLRQTNMYLYMSQFLPTLWPTFWDVLWMQQTKCRIINNEVPNIILAACLCYYSLFLENNLACSYAPHRSSSYQWWPKSIWYTVYCLDVLPCRTSTQLCDKEMPRLCWQPLGYGILWWDCKGTFTWEKHPVLLSGKTKWMTVLPGQCTYNSVTSYYGSNQTAYVPLFTSVLLE